MSHHGYEVEFPDGMIVRVSDFEAFMQLRQQYVREQGGHQAGRPTKKKAVKAKKVKPATATKPHGTFARFIEVLVGPDFDDAIQRMVAIIAARPNGVTSDKIVQGASLKGSGALGAFTAGINRACERAGVDKSDIYLKDKNKTYRPGPMLLKHRDDLPDVPQG